jgi:hypothetical protein
VLDDVPDPSGPFFPSLVESGVEDSERDEDSDDESDEESRDDPDEESCVDREPPLRTPRSFFAQPVPLKWIVGGANSLRIVCSRPHDGQNSGPGSLMPCRMSAR